MSLEIIASLFIPLLTAAFCILFWNNIAVQKKIFITGSVAFFIATFYLLYSVYQNGIMVTQPGSWPAPFGITLVADMLSALMVAVTGLMGLGTAIYSLQNIESRIFKAGYFPVFQFLLMGVTGCFLAGDIFNLYVWIEVMLIASFVLLLMGNSKEQYKGTLKYVVLNFLASALLVTGIGLLYGMTGSLNMADVAIQIREAEDSRIFNFAAMFFLIPFAAKAAMFPVYFWLPASYPAPPMAISGIFSGLLTKVGVYALIRFFTLIFVQDVAFTHYILLVGGAATMFFGVLGAVSKTSIRQILSFHIISQIGYMVIALAFFTPLAIAGAVFYIIHHIIVKTNLFLIAGVVETIKKSSNLNIIGGIYKRFPIFSFLFLIPALSLAGLPPLSGFWAKLMVIKAGFEVEQYFVVFVALITGILTLFSMTKIWNFAFWQAHPYEKPRFRRYNNDLEVFKDKFWLLSPIVLLAIFTLFIGLWSGPLFEFSVIAADQLLDPDQYINAVLQRIEGFNND